MQQEEENEFECAIKTDRERESICKNKVFSYKVFMDLSFCRSFLVLTLFCVEANCVQMALRINSADWNIAVECQCISDKANKLKKTHTHNSDKNTWNVSNQIKKVSFFFVVSSFSARRQTHSLWSVCLNCVASIEHISRILWQIYYSVQCHYKQHDKLGH